MPYGDLYKELETQSLFALQPLTLERVAVLVSGAFFFLFKIYLLFIYLFNLFLAALGLSCSTQDLR